MSIAMYAHEKLNCMNGCFDRLTDKHCGVQTFSFSTSQPYHFPVRATLNENANMGMPHCTDFSHPFPSSFQCLQHIHRVPIGSALLSWKGGRRAFQPRLRVFCITSHGFSTAPGVPAQTPSRAEAPSEPGRSRQAAGSNNVTSASIRNSEPDRKSVV